MSKKHQKRNLANFTEKQEKHALENQRAIIRRSTVEYLTGVILFLVLSILVLIAGLSVEDVSHSNRIVFIAFPMVLSISVVFVAVFVRHYIIYVRFNKIQYDSEETICIDCKAIKFKTVPISKHNFEIICVILIDNDRQKYYYISNEQFASKQVFKSKFLEKKVKLNCYKGTNFIKTYSATQ